jgi:glutaconate CoA-transferase, subunit B
VNAVNRRELMVACAAAEIRDGDIVFVGMRLPLLAFALATATHAPNAVGLFENGVVRDRPPSEPVVTMSDNPNLQGALQAGSTDRVMSLLASGRVDAGFIGGAQIDRHGNLNTTRIGPPDAPRVRLPGSGGGCDIASAAHRLLVIMAHEPRRFVPRVDHLTSPAFGAGRGWRDAVGLRPLESVTLITTRAVFRATQDTGVFRLATLHPGEDVEAVLADTPWGWEESPAHAPQTPLPTPAVVDAIRGLDPGGFWTVAAPPR